MSCPYCNKVGLPILPVRYAIGRADIGSVPGLAVPFGDGIQSIPLPAAIARYTLRLLRAGYLYMFDEARAEWTAYVVTPSGNLFEFDPKAKTAPTVPADSQPCARGNDPHVARCVTVKDAKHATKVWLGFSDVQWTPAVLKKNASAAARKQHMRSIDIAKWVGGAADQPHITAVDHLTDRVSEYAITPNNNLPIAKLPGMAAAVRALAGQAFGFSPYDFSARGEEAAAFSMWTKSASKPHKAAFVALDDPAGIVCELNELAKNLARLWVEDPVRRDKYASAMSIEAVRAAFGDAAQERQEKFQSELDQNSRGWYSSQAVAKIRTDAQKAPTVEQQAARMQLADDLDQLHALDAPRSLVSRRNSLQIAYEGRPLTPTETAAYQQQRSEIFAEAQQRKDARPGWKDQDIQNSRNQSWSKYRDSYKSDELAQFLDRYKNDLKSYDAKAIAPLDEAYVAWFKQDQFKRYIEGVFDPADPASGLAYLQVIHALTIDASGRAGSGLYFQQQYQADPQDTGSFLLRALVLNQTSLAEGWVEKAKEAKGELPWADTVAKFFDGYKDVLAKGAAGEIEGTFEKLAQLVYQHSAPIAKVLSQGVNVAAICTTEKLAGPRRLLMLLSSVLRAENPNWVIVDLRTMVTAQQASQLIATELSALSGKSEKLLAASVKKGPLFNTEAPNGTLRPYRGLVLIDKDNASQLGKQYGPNLVEGTTATLKPVDFESAVSVGARKLLNPEVKVGAVAAVLAIWVARCNYKEFAKAKPGEVAAAATKLGTGIAAIVGISVEGVGNILKKTTWGATRLGRPITFWFIRIESKADLLVWGGKLVGTVGAAIAGVLDMKEGYELQETHRGLGISLMLFGFGEIAIALFVFGGFITAGIGFIIGLVLAAIGFIIAFFKPDDLQKWLEKCREFGTLEKAKWFYNLEEQGKELKAVGAGD